MRLEVEYKVEPVWLLPTSLNSFDLNLFENSFWVAQSESSFFPKVLLFFEGFFPELLCFGLLCFGSHAPLFRASGFPWPPMWRPQRSRDGVCAAPWLQRVIPRSLPLSRVRMGQ